MPVVEGDTRLTHNATLSAHNPIISKRTPTRTPSHARHRRFEMAQSPSCVALPNDQTAHRLWPRLGFTMRRAPQSFVQPIGTTRISAPISRPLRRPCRGSASASAGVDTHTASACCSMRATVRARPQRLGLRMVARDVQQISSKVVYQQGAPAVADNVRQRISGHGIGNRIALRRNVSARKRAPRPLDHHTSIRSAIAG